MEIGSEGKWKEVRGILQKYHVITYNRVVHSSVFQVVFHLVFQSKNNIKNNNTKKSSKIRWNRKTPLRGVFQKFSIFHSFFHFVFHWGIQSPICAMSHITYHSFFITPWSVGCPSPWPHLVMITNMNSISTMATNVTTNAIETWAQTQLQMPIQMWMPTQMRFWTKQKQQCKCRYPHQVHIHEASHGTCASNVCQQPDGSTIHTMAC